MKRKERKEGFVAARIRKQDMELLKKHNINISSLIQEAVASAVRELK